MPNVYALFNASRSIYLFLAQWRLVLSESAVYIGYCLLLLLSLLPWQCSLLVLTLYHKIYELFYLWCQTKLELQEKLCNKCPGGNSFETAVIVILFAISGFTSNDRAPGGPVTLLGKVIVSIGCYGFWVKLLSQSVAMVTGWGCCIVLYCSGLDPFSCFVTGSTECVDTISHSLCPLFIASSLKFNLRLQYTLLTCCGVKISLQHTVRPQWTLAVLSTSLTQLNCGQLQCHVVVKRPIAMHSEC